MTMDITSRRSDLKSDVSISSEEPISNKTVKRSFDVAFLMRPDDKLKQKSESNEILQDNNNIDKGKTDEGVDYHPNFNTSKAFELEKIKSHARYLQNALHKHQVFGDPSLVKPRVNQDAELYTLKSTHLHCEQKSAFTKVNLVSKESRASPSLSASPDVNYQHSLSPSPPILNRSYHNMLSPNHIFKAQNIPAYQTTFIQENLNNFGPSALENPFVTKTHHPTDLLQPNFAAKMRPMLSQYRHELAYNYPQFQQQPDLKFPADIRNPAAAILSTLLPPSLAALSLPAQNICAKCNVSFRMTSDLVYHMRSHHKNDAVDISKKRREDKLKCPVCAESFRERHHLTRHMTAHQDKDEDDVEPVNKKSFALNQK